MKRTAHILFYLSTLIIAGGCKKFLTEEPLSQVPVENYFTKQKDINAAITGMYASLQDEMTGDGSGNGNYFYWGEGRSDNFDRSQYPNSAITELSLNQLTSGNFTSDWSGLYRTINRANLAIKNIPLVQKYDINVTNVFRDNSLAQCYAMRALCYFYIVRIWGDAVIRTEPYESIAENASVPRESKDKIINELIIPDLQKAYGLIQKNQKPIVWNIGEATIAAILSDVYMWQKDYANAITWMKNVFIAQGPKGTKYNGASGADLEPTSTWKNLFINPTATNEAIWSIHWDQLVNECACLPVSISNNNNPIRIDSLLHSNWKANPTDTRVAKSIDTLLGLGHIDKVTKYYNLAGLSFPTGSGAPDQRSYNVYLTMYRLGDIYLSYAEALNKTGDRSNALKYLNFIRVRAGLPAYLITDPAVAAEADMEDTILKERQLELFAEGKRWFDLVRTDHVKKVMDTVLIVRQQRYGAPAVGFGDDMRKLVWPIHRQVIEDNKTIEQNLPYN
ncbi:oxygenase [Niastella yeongjuensis]|uniref:Oxygenase n=1 Tax=Niastella yeongjuensis TaxID=354355 RepID=A0A1V9EMI0_9BACT|nr:RagB/SusD family nutrient uptake outer membrane protein [Niastella yeongjuensis]OQP47326.1 oxygenase [Niastella yeongjuensis]SEN78935.1 Starch-binding associating with outer membrane [Niastella yeongjuensis]